MNQKWLQDNDQNQSEQTQQQNARILITCSRKALLNNYEVMREQMKSQRTGYGILPMVKANAYGHGMGWVANTLAKQPDLEGFGVATLEEGIQLRKDLTFGIVR
jgi:alanine racemase